MRKNSIDGHMKTVKDIGDYLNEVKNRFECIKSHNIKDYSKSEQAEARESFEYCENELLMALIQINKLSEALIKKIDPEAWDER
jgi:hypothetical protein